LRSIRYVGYVACSAFYFCCLFAFIAGSPFVYIDYFGIPPQYYGFLFGVNVLGMIASTFVNSRIVVRFGGFALLFTGLAQVGGIIGLAIPLFVVLSLLTMVASNAISGRLAGKAPILSASAFLACWSDSDEQPGSPINRLFTLKIDRETLLQMISLSSKEIMESGDGPVLIDFVRGWQSSDVIDDGVVFKWLVVDDRQIASRFCEAIRRWYRTGV
jgi:hypothetical protein